jgi:hypothetical protein
MFSEDLCSPTPSGSSCSSKNALIPMLGPPLLELLFDLFVLPGGPRLRDKLSHGETDFEAESGKPFAKA